MSIHKHPKFAIMHKIICYFKLHKYHLKGSMQPMGFKKIDFKTWLFPSICFGLFCYGMIFIFIYTYASSENVSLFSTTKSSTNTTDIAKFKEEMVKQIKKVN